ncbi:hypothetical protein Tsubulata_032163, partial [Turnera subulata]
MDAETALELVKQGASLLLIDVPQYTLIGIDTQLFTVGPAFKGIKMIPPGPHFVYYSSSSRDGKEFSPITGFFINAGPSEVIVRRWDQLEERLVKVSEEEEERFSQAVKSLEFDRHLGPYNHSQYGDWKRLSNYVTKDVIERLEPIGGEITVACESEMLKRGPKTLNERALDEQLRTSKFSTPTSTELLESILVKHYGGSEDLLLGELQFAYIAFLMGQSLDAFYQWKSLTSLLLSCIKAFMRVIYYQLKYGLQKDKAEAHGAGSSLLDESWFSADSFLHRLCKTRKLKELLESNLGWEFQQSSAVDGLYFEEDDEIRNSSSICLKLFKTSYYRRVLAKFSRDKHYDLFGSVKPGDDDFKEAWKKQMEDADDDDCLWTGSEDEAEDDHDPDPKTREKARLAKEIRKARQQAKQRSSLIDANDSDELYSVWSDSDEEKTLWTGDEGDDDDDIPTEAYPNEASDKYIDKLFEFEEKPKYRTISELLKAETEPEELSPGKQARKLAVENALKKLKKGPDGRYTNVWEVMSDIDILIGAFENVVSGPEYEELRQGGPKRLNMEFFKDIQARMRDPNYKFSPEIKLKPKSKLVPRRRWQKAESRRRKAQRR